MYIKYGLEFDGAGSWSSGNDFARKFIIFGFHSSSSFHSKCRKNRFLILSEGLNLNYDINSSFGSPEKDFSINFSERN